MKFENLGFFAHENIALHIQGFRLDAQDVFVFVFRCEERIVTGKFHCERLSVQNAKDWLFTQLRALHDDQSIVCEPTEHCAQCALECVKIARVLREWLGAKYAAFLAAAMARIGE